MQGDPATGERNVANEISLYFPVVSREARRLCAGDRFIGEDLVQEGLIAALKALDSYDPQRGSAMVYIRTCARNKMISYLRQNGRTAAPLPEDLDLADSIDPADPMSAQEPDPAEALEAKETLSALIECLSPFEQRVLGAYLREGGVTEAAIRLGCSRKKVDNAMQRIRSKARR